MRQHRVGIATSQLNRHQHNNHLTPGFTHRPAHNVLHHQRVHLKQHGHFCGRGGNTVPPTVCRGGGSSTGSNIILYCASGMMRQLQQQEARKGDQLNRANGRTGGRWLVHRTRLSVMQLWCSPCNYKQWVHSQPAISPVASGGM